MSWRFHELFRKKLQILPHFVKKHDKPLIWPKHCNFSNKLPCLCIAINFSGKSCKKWLISWNSTKNHWFGQSFATFGTSYNVFFLFMNFQEKSCKKCVVSWKSTKNHWLCQLAAFRENYDVLTFRWTLQQKVAKSCSCREKARKIIDLAKTLQLFEQTTMFWHFHEVFSKKLQKVPRLVKKHEKWSIWPKLATFRTNYHVLAFRWTFQEKNAKSGPFHEKARTLIDFAKTSNFSKKLPCFGISMIIAGKSCKRWKKWLISWKMTKNNRFGLNLQLFEETTMFRRFCQLFSKKWVISWKSTKNRHSEVA